MTGFVRRIICYIVIALIIFFAVALWTGGEKFRWYGEKSAEEIRKSSEKLGEKADAIKKAKEKTVKRIRKWTGSGDGGKDEE